MDLSDILKQLTDTLAPSGFETPIAEKIISLWQQYVDEISIDRMGNVVAIKRGSGPEPRAQLMLAAHMDEIGLMVTKLEEHNGYGFLRVSRLGGVDIRHLYGQTVSVHGQKELFGILGALPTFMFPDHKATNTPFDYETLVVDTGLTFTQLQDLVSIGDAVSFVQPLRHLTPDFVTSKSLDNRASVAAVTICLEYLQTRNHTADIIAVATVQEETRLLGASTSSHTLQPNLAIAIDVTFGKGADAQSAESYELGAGPTIGFGPNLHPAMFKQLRSTAKILEMKTHPEPHAQYSGTDAAAIHLSRNGIPTGLIGIPLRYMHTMVETAHLQDIRRAGRLMGEFSANLTSDFLVNLHADLMDGIVDSETGDEHE